LYEAMIAVRAETYYFNKAVYLLYKASYAFH